MTNAKPSFLGKAKGYKKHGAIAVLFVFVEIVCLSAYRGRFLWKRMVFTANMSCHPEPCFVALPAKDLKTYLHPVLLTSRIILRFFRSPSGLLGQNDKMI